jgi:hypothetical protein
VPLKTRSHRPVPKKHGAPGKGGLCPKTTPAKAAALCGARSAPFSEQLNAYSEQLNATVRHKDPVLVAFTLPSDPCRRDRRRIPGALIVGGGGFIRERGCPRPPLCAIGAGPDRRNRGRGRGRGKRSRCHQAGRANVCLPGRAHFLLERGRLRRVVEETVAV